MRRAGLLVGLLAAPAAAQSLHFEGSAGLATGTYTFVERTSSWSVSPGLAFGAGPVTLRATVPVYYLTVMTVGATETITAVGTRRWRTGDPLVSASVAGIRAGPLAVLAGASVKVPLVDTASVGTGAWDVGGSLAGSLMLGWRAFLSLDVAYWHLGDPPDLELTDPLVVTGAASWFGGGWGLSAGMTGSTPTIPGFGPAVSATASVLRLAGRAGFGVVVTAGLTDAAPDVTAALTWRLRLID